MKYFKSMVDLLFLDCPDGLAERIKESELDTTKPDLIFALTLGSQLETGLRAVRHPGLSFHSRAVRATLIVAR